ncbi:hypothetical protein AYI68_g7360 [Smittium mucronatum]|uniref:TUG ubiquitin-like domain-containing protein n=1 Tax=Smittium mucronatum TaxID=133383 RepID=A0A1R0GNY4_9FUNG|nr:hypothetical protein AYI68_g7360 [Smittium mucronatum]
MTTSLKVTYQQYKNVTVKVNPNMSLKAVVNHVCNLDKSLGDSDIYGLSWKKKKLDLSSSIRFANLPQGANLDLVADTSADARWHQKERSSYSQHLSKVAVRANISFKYSGLTAFESTTLKSLGCSSGSLLIRVFLDSSAGQSSFPSQKSSNVPSKSSFLQNFSLSNLIKSDSGSKSVPKKLSDSSDISSQTFPDSDPKNTRIPVNNQKPLISEPKSANSSVKEEKPLIFESKSADIPENKGKPLVPENELLPQDQLHLTPPKIEVFIYIPKTQNTSLSDKEFDVPDDFFELTQDEAKALVQENNERNSQQRGFTTKDFRDKKLQSELEKKKSIYSNVIIFIISVSLTFLKFYQY